MSTITSINRSSTEDIAAELVQSDETADELTVIRSKLDRMFSGRGRPQLSVGGPTFLSTQETMRHHENLPTDEQPVFRNKLLQVLNRFPG